MHLAGNTRVILRAPGSPRCARGFTLIEASLAVAIVGLGLLSSMALFEACTRQTRNANQTTTALMLVTHVQEAMVGLSFSDPGSATLHWGPELGESRASYNDLDDFDGLTFNPPIDALRAPLPNQSQYTQQVDVMPIDPNMPGQNADVAAPTIGKGTYTGAVRVRVTVLYKPTPTSPSETLMSSSWIKMDQ
jgi:prepilin-type N-terminal cleavage/methylation domain-containing protein